jgi:hypothetical protein
VTEKYLKNIDGKYILDSTSSKIPLEIWDKDMSDSSAPLPIEELVRTIRMLGQPVPPELQEKLDAARDTIKNSENSK